MIFRFQLTKPNRVFINILFGIFSNHLEEICKHKLNEWSIKNLNIDSAFQVFLRFPLSATCLFFRFFDILSGISREVYDLQEAHAAKLRFFLRSPLILDLGQGLFSAVQ